MTGYSVAMRDRTRNLELAAGSTKRGESESWFFQDHREWGFGLRHNEPDKFDHQETNARDCLKPPGISFVVSRSVAYEQVDLKFGRIRSAATGKLDPKCPARAYSTGSLSSHYITSALPGRRPNEPVAPDVN